MNPYTNASFSVNRYDKDGDLMEECVLVHIGATILQFSTVSQLDGFIEQLNRISREIKAKG